MQCFLRRNGGCLCLPRGWAAPIVSRYPGIVALGTKQATRKSCIRDLKITSLCATFQQLRLYCTRLQSGPYHLFPIRSPSCCCTCNRPAHGHYLVLLFVDYCLLASDCIGCHPPTIFSRFIQMLKLAVCCGVVYMVSLCFVTSIFRGCLFCCFIYVLVSFCR